ncbi:MAG: HPP family protein [Bacteroides sp.]
MERKKRIKYLVSILMILFMIGVAEWTGEKEIIFPEMAALTIGLWIVDKRVWRVKRSAIVWLMTLGAFAGVCIVRYSPLSLTANLSLAFVLAGLSLLCSRTTLIPLISACMLPVLLHTETWVYPISVFFLSLILVLGQRILERYDIRQPIAHSPSDRNWKKDLFRWMALLAFVFPISALAIGTENTCLILPPLIVTFTEFAHSKAGFRNRPVQIFFILVGAATLGTVLQWVGYTYLHLPETVVAFVVIGLLFLFFERSGKFFAPAGALALIPMIVPQEQLLWLPLQAAVGTALFLTVAMIVFQQCYKWNRAQLVYCITPSVLRNNRKKRNSNQ